MKSASAKLIAKNNESKFICVGLDTDINKIPSHLRNTENPILEFNKQIIESTKDLAAAYKINFAFYEKDGKNGFENLEKTFSLIPDDILIIADAKRGDIGNTSKMYAQSIFEYFACDSITVNPFMGTDSIMPFLDYHDKLIFILALTSNPGSDDFEKLKLIDGSYLFQSVIKKVNEWNINNNCGLVFGATKSDDLIKNINLMQNLPVLLPGVGAQGGSLEDVIHTFKKSNRKNFLVNISRGIIYRSSDINFNIEARNELIRYNDIAKAIINK